MKGERPEAQYLDVSMAQIHILEEIIDLGKVDA